MGMGLTPLHSTIYGYHVSRVNETCELIDELLNAGANAQIVNKVSCNNFLSSDLNYMYYHCDNIFLILCPYFHQLVRGNSGSSCCKHRRLASSV